MKITAKIHKISDTKEVSERFKKRDFVVEYATNPTYPQLITFQLVQDKCDLLDSYQPGQFVEIEFQINGREWTSPQGEVKYFNTLQAWRLTPAETQPQFVEVDDLFEGDDEPF